MRWSAAFFSVVGAASAAQNTQLAKVIQMLGDMQRAGAKRLNEEQVAFAAFDQHCTSEKRTLKEEIDAAAEEMKQLKADIAMSESNAAKLQGEIADHNANVAKYEAQQKKETAERKEGRAAAMEEEQDFAESVDALSRAIMILKRQAHDKEQTSLLELPDRAQKLVEAFYQEPGVAKGYESQSGGVLEMLKRLKGEFKEKLSVSQKEERNAQHSYEMIMQDTTHQLNTNKKSIGEKTVAMQQALKAAGKAKGQLATTTEEHKDQSETLQDAEVECQEKKLSVEEKQKLAADEQEAIKEAIKILEEIGNGNVSAGQSFLQIRSKLTGNRDTTKVFNFLSEESMKLSSKNLALVATKMGEGPFDKVITMVKGMITKLRQDGQKEAEKHSFCTKEIAASKADRERLNAELDSLTADRDEASATAAQLKQDIKELRAQIVALDKMVAEATSLHFAEKEQAEKTIKETKQAQQAVAAARAVLTDFYAKAGKATAFIQTPTMGSDEWNALANPNFVSEGGVGYGQEAQDGVTVVDEGHKKGMQTFGDVNQGQQEASTGVIAMLDVILSDFARQEAEATTLLAESTKNFEKMSTDSKRDKAVKERKIEMNTEDMQEAEHDFEQAKHDIESTSDQLAAANRSWKSIEEQCVDKGVSQEDRNAKREEEIQALKEALEMLSQDAE